MPYPMKRKIPRGDPEDKMERPKKVNINATLHFVVDTKEKLQHIHNAANELEKAGITFDTGGDSEGDVHKEDWELDFSLQGGATLIMYYDKVFKKGN
jgi:hypothetical protein